MTAQRLMDNISSANIDVGVSPIFVTVIARIIRDVSPKVGSTLKVQIQFKDTSTLLSDVIGSKLDMAILPVFDFLKKDELDHVCLSEKEKLCFYASPHSPAAIKKHIVWQDFTQLTLIGSQGAYFLNKMVRDKLVSEGIKNPPQISVKVNNLECMKKIVKDGEGISYCLFQDIEDEVKAGTLTLVYLPDDFYIKIDAVTKKDFVMTPLVKAFIDCAKKAFKKPDYLMNPHDFKTANSLNG
jgi:DNA-binding transcriptional LysR family regulator